MKQFKINKDIGFNVICDFMLESVKKQDVEKVKYWFDYAANAGCYMFEMDQLCFLAYAIAVLDSSEKGTEMVDVILNRPEFYGDIYWEHGGEDAFIYACKYCDNMESFKKIINSGKVKFTNFDKSGETGMMWLCTGKPVHSDEKLDEILKVCDVETINQQEVDGYTCLMFAVGSGDENKVHKLLEAGADPNKKEFKKHRGCLLSACMKVSYLNGEYRGILKDLLQHGANPNSIDDDGVSPLSFIQENCKDKEIVGMVEKYAKEKRFGE